MRSNLPSAPRRILCAGALLGVLAVTASLPADGFIYIHHPHPVPPRPIPMPWPVPRPEFPLQVVKHRVEVKIDGTMARTRVEETFYNPNGAQLEGTYLFPLPPGASVTRFSMMVGGKEAQGEVLERDKARSIYEAIVRQMRDPGLLEFVDRGLFRARVFPIPAMGNVEVRVEYDENLPQTAGIIRYRYPLNTGKYSAGDYKDVLIDATLRSGSSIRSVTCLSHGASVSRPNDREARVVFEAKTLTADKDFTLDWNVGEDALAPVLLTQRTHEPDGFFFLSIAPRPDKPKAPPAKDLVAVIDTSGSMLGGKIDQARKALRHFVAGLNPGDRFGIIDFSTEARQFRPSLAAADEETRRQALAFIDGLQARGGTNIEEALRMALTALDASGDENRMKMAIFITDGEPTVGITRPEDILRSVRTANGKGRRIFSFGVGVDLNAQLLERLAQENRGALDYVLAGENLELKLSSFWDKIDFPVLTDLRLEFPNLATSDVYPKPLPDLFRGETLAITGRFREDGRRSMVLRGKFQGEERVFEYSLDFTPPPSGKSQNDFIARQWATRKIGYLLEAMRLGGESKEVKDEVIRLSQQYGVLTPYTSYLILEEGDRRLAGVRPGQPAPAPLSMPAAGALREGLAAAPASVRKEAQAKVQDAKRSFGADRGDAGVAGGRAVEALKLGKAAPAGSAEAEGKDSFEALSAGGKRVQQVGSRAFYLLGERWVEGGLLEKDLAAAKRIEYLSDAYFELLGKNPGIGELLGVGAKVTFRWKAETITIE